jgi:primary-amine oxidase
MAQSLAQGQSTRRFAGNHIQSDVVVHSVLASNHQHLFSVRLDPSIDGHNNTVVQEDSVAMRFDKINPPVNNLYGVGYTVEKTPITHSGWADAAPEKNRVFKM